MNYKLLPPRPSIDDAMAILNIPQSPNGLKQILQHIAYDGLGLFVPMTVDAVKYDDERIFVENLIGADVLKIDSEKIDVNLTHEENKISRLVGHYQTCKCVVVSTPNQKDYSLRVDSFLHNGEEYLPLGHNTEFSQELRDFHLGSYPSLEEIGDDEWALAERKMLGYYIHSYKLKSFRPNLNSSYFEREELIQFAESFNEIGILENRPESGKTNETLSTHDPQKAKDLSINDTRKLAFKFWLAGKGDPESVENMTKKEVWQELQKVDARLFANGFDALFNDSKTKQNLVIFKTGRRK